MRLNVGFDTLFLTDCYRDYLRQTPEAAEIANKTAP